MAGTGVPFWLDQANNPDPASFTVAPDPWSIVYMGPNLVALPGLLDDGDVHWRKPPHRNIDKGKKTSVDGANPKLQGYGIAEFDLPMVIHSRGQLALLTQILQVIWPGKSSPVTTGNPPGVAVAPGNGIPGAQGVVGLNLTQVVSGGGSKATSVGDKPILIQHPALTLAGISQVLMEGWTPPRRWKGRNDIKVYILHCMEFRPGVAKQTTTPKQIAGTPINARTLPVNPSSNQPSAGPGLALGG